MRKIAPQTCTAAFALGLLAAFSLFTIVWEPGGSPRLDGAALQLGAQLIHLNARVDARALLWLAGLLGEPSVDVLLTAGLTGLLLAQRRRPAALLAPLAAAMVLLVEVILRVPGEAVLFHDPSPALAHPLGVALVQGTYPSGHTARALLLAGIAAEMVPSRLRALAMAAAVAIGLSVGLERLVYGLHTGSDVVGGLLLGGGLACWYAALVPWLESGSALSNNHRLRETIHTRSLRQ